MGRKRKTVTTPPHLLALDISSVCVGWAAFTVEGDLHSHGRWIAPKGGHGERLFMFGEWLKELLPRLGVQEIVVEWPYHGGRRNAYGVLIQYCAMAVVAHWAYFSTELPEANRVPAREVKRLLGFERSRVAARKRHEDNKRKVVRWANETYGLRLRFVAGDTKKRRTQDDEADAIAVGAAWFLRMGHGVG